MSNGIAVSPKQRIEQARHLKTPSRSGQPANSIRFASSSPSPHSVNGGLAIDYDGTAVGTNPSQEKGKQLTIEQRRKVEKYGATYAVEEDSLRNDYSSAHIQTGDRPQNSLTSTALEDRFSEYPKLAALLALKHALYDSPLHSIPPTYLTTSSVSQSLSSLAPLKFDSILISPPPTTSFEELLALDLNKVASSPSFVWLWVGSGAASVDGSPANGIGLEKGRELISAWGFRRCEDIVWLKTNRSHPQNDLTTKPTSLFTSSVEHCLMGIKGTVRRSTDSWIAHCNVDTDVIVWEGDALDRDLKPPELHALIEQFCNGTRRLHLYASPHSLRRGWLSLGTTFEPIVADSTSSPTSPPQTASTPIILPIEGERATWTPTPYDPHDYSTRFVHFDQTSSNSTHTRLLSRDDISRMMQSSSLIDRGMEDSMIEGRKRIEVILPFVEELDALRPKSPPPRNGLPSSGGLGRGRGAGLGVTRSNNGLQHDTIRSSYRNGYSQATMTNGMNQRGYPTAAYSSQQFNRPMVSQSQSYSPQSYGHFNNYQQSQQSQYQSQPTQQVQYQQQNQFHPQYQFQSTSSPSPPQSRHYPSAAVYTQSSPQHAQRSFEQQYYDPSRIPPTQYYSPSPHPPPQMYSHPAASPIYYQPQYYQSQNNYPVSSPFVPSHLVPQHQQRPHFSEHQFIDQ